VAWSARLSWWSVKAIRFGFRFVAGTTFGPGQLVEKSRAFLDLGLRLP
jgi:hypothetical protein